MRATITAKARTQVGEANNDRIQQRRDPGSVAITVLAGPYVVTPFGRRDVIKIPVFQGRPRIHEDKQYSLS